MAALAANLAASGGRSAAMICVIAPSKGMDFSGKPNCGVMSQPVFGKETTELLSICKRMTKTDLQKQMDMGDAIGQINFDRYQNWENTACKAVSLAMDGPAFQGFDGNSLTAEERKVAQGKVRILSGLYGVLKPFDAIRPYRLEMACALRTDRGSNLYAFWGDAIAKEISKGAKVIINAASQEYWKAVRVAALDGVPVVTINFPGASVFAKRARGMICRYAVQNRFQKAEDLKGFTGDGANCYVFDAGKSTDTKYVFNRVSTASAKAKATPAAAVTAKGAPAKRPAGAAAAGGGKRGKTG